MGREYLLRGTTTVMVSTPWGSKPASSVLKSHRLRIMRPAPTNKISERATSDTSRMLLVRWPPESEPVFPRPCFRASLTLVFVMRIAGSSPAITPVTMEIKMVKASTEVSRETSVALGKLSDRNFSVRPMPNFASRRPSAPPASDSSKDLLNYAAAGGTQGYTDGDFFAASKSLCQHQIGDVGAGDEKYKCDSAEQDEECRAHVGDELFTKRDDHRTPAFVVFRILFGEARGNGIHLGLGWWYRNAGLETSDGQIVVLAAHRALLIGPAHGGPILCPI